ncbi:hypothetical protein RmaAA338_09450 [Rhodothermus marinus]|nr:hypothetical protein RmaAA338_09450 [Rhodothermus marinus]
MHKPGGQLIKLRVFRIHLGLLFDCFAGVKGYLKYPPANPTALVGKDKPGREGEAHQEKTSAPKHAQAPTTTASRSPWTPLPLPGGAVAKGLWGSIRNPP